ncbi:hypothetical protein [Kibdelosporangium philippinense]|uniref:hypothetical protein n=1 Tax=Kibdelosporangium philippinense TaxID=211113 RepID=UPI00361C959C
MAGFAPLLIGHTGLVVKAGTLVGSRGIPGGLPPWWQYRRPNPLLEWDRRASSPIRSTGRTGTRSRPVNTRAA